MVFGGDQSVGCAAFSGDVAVRFLKRVLEFWEVGISEGRKRKKDVGMGNGGRGRE